MPAPIVRLLPATVVLAALNVVPDAIPGVRSGTVAAQEPSPATLALDEAIGRADSRNWRARRDVRELADGSTLASYVGETRSLGERDAVLRIEFVPRFGCAPGIDLVVEADLAARLPRSGSDDAPTGGAVDDDELRFAIDGTRVGYPVLLDSGDGATTFAYNGDEREREGLRSRLDAGGVASLGLAEEDEPLRFSLLGSRRTLAAMEALCSAHEPIDPKADVANEAD